MLVDGAGESAGVVDGVVEALAAICVGLRGRLVLAGKNKTRRKRKNPKGGKRANVTNSR